MVEVEEDLMMPLQGQQILVEAVVDLVNLRDQGQQQVVQV